MPEILVAEEHSQVYDSWLERGQRDLKICHIDFHCDMRGLLIDRRRGRAYMIDSADGRVAKPDSGNFLAHAVVDGVVTGIRWVHDDYGGRRYDTGTVKYERDLTALPHRLVHRLRGGREVPIDYQELSFDAWDGVRAGELLDIDWDGLASVDYDREHIERLTEAFLAKPFAAIPETTYLVYSPGYSHPDRSIFDGFLERLATKLGATVTELPRPAAITPASGGRRLAEAVERAVVLGLRRVGIY